MDHAAAPSRFHARKRLGGTDLPDVVFAVDRGDDGNSAALCVRRLLSVRPFCDGHCRAAAASASFWRRATQPAIRAALVVICAAGLSVLVSGGVITLAFLAFDCVLVGATWGLIRAGRVSGAGGIIWIIALIIALAASKLIQTQALIGPAVWIGISYLIFRLIHMTVDARSGRLGTLTLAETIVYTLHPATLVAGPIDRAPHNVAEQRSPRTPPQPYLADGLWRLFIGVFKKVALANLCYEFVAAHDITRAPYNHLRGIAWLWLLAYTFYIYFDFAGYSDIAIGVARLMGIRLPENFANPYMQPNIARFWQAWHITLSNWLRDYLFFPISRRLLKRYGTARSVPILLISHLTTMFLCGLWHGLGSGFAAWGVWHGVGLFAYSQVTPLRRRFNLPAPPKAASILITFGFVALGWVFFSNDVGTALHIFGQLFGGG